MTDTPTPASADVIEGMQEARSTLLTQIDRLFDETEREYIPDVSAIDVRLSFQTRLRIRTLAEMRRAIAALALPDSPTTHKGGPSDD